MKGDVSLLIVGYLVGMVVLVGVVYYAMSGGQKPEATPTPSATPTAAATSVFGLDTPTPAATATPAPARRCEDGTPLDSCNDALKACRSEDGTLSLVEDCKLCGCEFGQKCSPLDNRCFVGCDDGTPLLLCSNATPDYYCDENMSLAINGFECGCPRGYQYDPYGSGPYTVNGCTSTCRSGPECNRGR
ncbi:MAG: hypothetical protein V1787_03815 [Candidatus Micrarchaeota archaeon]